MYKGALTALIAVLLVGCAATQTKPLASEIQHKYKKMDLRYQAKYTKHLGGDPAKRSYIRTREEVIADKEYNCQDWSALMQLELAELGQDVAIVKMSRINNPFNLPGHVAVEYNGNFIESRTIRTKLPRGMKIDYRITPEGREYPDGTRTANSPAWAEYYEGVGL